MTTAPQMKGRTAVVTGATSGIGAEIADQLAGHGAHLVLVARSAELLETTAARLRVQYGVDVLTAPLDLADRDSPRLLSHRLAEAGIEVEMLVNNAAVNQLGALADTDPMRLRAMLELNVGALAELTARLLPGMVRRGRGAVLNISSTGAYQPTPYMAAYSASKSFVLSFTQAVWAEVAGTGVRVVAVAPGPTDTPMNAAAATPRERQPADVARTALSALGRRRPAVVDGGGNALQTFVFGRLMPAAIAARLGKRIIESSILRR
ncbi:SDR family NAD(P)-dependent oxidoreductase [Streptomyces tsukubensis]|uniref:Dehydrogenase n=1 Tax=Streptomyces tsukubensis TaxID=83656 RepID=A0A1V4ACZ9_9ACTN|nr:SDR family oxidoreductase [Streptomyces tsukubensis]OON81105.1 dehydrogenase [Streptomyces tsukubensis]QFR94939.1 SDR family NAD(P)-dependent oxidoreductase [Streptomyces tsukubensis]